MVRRTDRLSVCAVRVLKTLQTVSLLLFSVVLVCGLPAARGGGLAANQGRFLMMVARQSDLDFEGQAINQTRLWLANLTGGLNNRLAALPPNGSPPVERRPLYRRSYALVVGIDDYASEHWPNLKYAVRDAQGVATYLESRGFEVATLYNEEATARAIAIELRHQLAPKLEAEDRVIFFFAGHGHTEQLNGRPFGSLVPHGGGEYSADYLSMDRLRELSRMMGRAKHQLFIVDACYGGLLAKRGVSQPAPGKDSQAFLKEVTTRRARQILTAGGADEMVVDDGPGGHSVFTGYLLRALETPAADANRDGYVTFSELTTYLGPRATSPLQTPAWSIFDKEHEPGGEFVFRLPGDVAPRELQDGELDIDSILQIFESIQKLDASRNGLIALRQQIEALQGDPKRFASVKELQLTVDAVSARLPLLQNNYDVLRSEMLGFEALGPLGESSENADAAAIEARIRALQEMDGILKTRLDSLDTQRQMVATEIETMRQEISEPASSVFRQIGVSG